MHNDAFHQRIKQLYRMLFELATGNLLYRIEPQTQDDITKLVDALNTFAAQLQLTIRKSGYVLPYYSYQNLAHSALILDVNFTVIGFIKDASFHYMHDANALLGISAIDLIHPNSKSLWEELVRQAKEENELVAVIHLNFLTGTKDIQPSFCSMYRLLGTPNFLLSCITTTIEEIAELNQSANGQLHEVRVIQELYHYIMENLEKPLPTIKQLAVMFSTNEFKLKQGFRHFFNSGIHNFYNSERLKRAHLLIQQTNHQLKTIALLSGFQDYGTFSKAFKKKFGYGPGSLSRNF